MAKEKNLLFKSGIFFKIKNGINAVFKSLVKRKVLAVGIVILLIAYFAFNNGLFKKKTVDSKNPVISKSVTINKSFDFPALTNQGKASPSKIKFKIANIEKTGQVLVKEQIYTAKNNKTFLIAGIELKNDATVPLNIVPGDLVRLTYDGDESNKFAPDLHNNMVMVSAISTKLDRIGFVVPQEARDFKLYVGELEGKKEIVSVNFPS